MNKLTHLLKYSLQPRSLLVTGGAGFIGSAFIRYLLENLNLTVNIVNLDLLTYAGNLQNLASVEKDPRYIFVHGDISNEELVENLCVKHQVDTIVHFAAESHVDRSIDHPQNFIETNVLGTFHLLEVVKRHPHIHFHHVSTDEVYGSLGELGYFTETTPYHPNSPYSASKAASDHLVRAYHHTYHISVTISNCSNNYGPFQYPEKLIPLMILNCLNSKALPIYGTGLNIRDWLYVDDHVEAIWTILLKGKSGETYNIGGGAEWKNLDLIKEIIKIISHINNTPQDDLMNLITFVNDRPGHDTRYAIDCSKINNQLGWYPRYSFKDGLIKTVEWYINDCAIQQLVD